MASIGELVSNIGNSISRTLSTPSPRYTRVRSSAPTQESFKTRLTSSFDKFKQDKQNSYSLIKSKTADLAKILDRDKSTPGFQVFKPQENKFLTPIRRAVEQQTPVGTVRSAYDAYQKVKNPSDLYQSIPLSARKKVVDFLSTPEQRSKFEQQQNTPAQKMSFQDALNKASSKESIDRFVSNLRGEDTVVRKIPGVGSMADTSAGYLGSTLGSFQKFGETMGKNQELINQKTEGMSSSERLSRKPEIDEALNLLRGGWELAKGVAKLDPTSSAGMATLGGAFNLAFGDREKSGGTRFGEGAAEGAGLKPLLQFTNPATEWLVGKVGGGPLLSQLLKRTVGGGANVGEDRIINYLDNTPERINDTFSFLFAFALTGNDDVAKVIRKELDAGKSLSESGEIPTTTKQVIVQKILGAQDSFSRGKESLAKRLDDFGNKIGQDYRTAMENSGKEGGFIKPDEFVPKPERLKAKKEYASKVLNESETVDEALFNIQSIVNDARFGGTSEDFQAIKQALKEYKSLLVTGPGLPRNPEYDALFTEIDNLLATKIKDFKINPEDAQVEKMSESIINDDPVLGDARAPEELPSKVDEAIVEQGSTTTPEQAKYEQEALSPTGEADDIVAETDPLKAQLKQEQDRFIQQQEAQRVADAQKAPEVQKEDPEVQKLKEDAQRAVFGEEVKTAQDIKEKYQNKKPEQIIKDVVIDPTQSKIEGSVLEYMDANAELGRKLRQQEKLPKDIKGAFLTAMDDEFYWAKKYDAKTYELLRLMNGGGDRMTAAIIEHNVGPTIKAEIEAGRQKDFSNLLNLDRTKELIERGKKRDMGMADIERGLQELRSKYTPEELAEMGEHANQIRGFMSNLLNRLEETGIISKEDAEIIRENNEFYITFESVGKMIEDNAKQGWWKTSSEKMSKSFNVARQDVIKAIGDDESGTTDSIENSLQYMAKVIELVEKNKIISDLVSRRGAQFVDGKLVNPDGSDNIFLIPLRQAENVRERMRLNKEIGEFIPVRNKIERLIQTRDRAVRKLNSEINKLNKQGLLSYLKEPIKTFPDELRSAVIEKQKIPGSGVTTDTGDKFFVQDDSVPIQRKLTQKYAQSTDRGPQSTKRFIESLVELPKSEIERIKRKIDTRETKTLEILDEISSMSDELTTIKDTIVDARIKRGDLSDIKDAPEGFEKISYFNDGIKEEWAVPQELAVAIKGLDRKQSGFVLDIWNKVFTTPAKRFFTQLNPIFGLITNPIKDFGNMLFSKATTEGFKSSAELMGAYANTMKNSFGLNPIKTAWELTGGSSSGIMGAELKSSPEKYIADISKKPHKFLHLVTTPVRIGEAFEANPRIATFEQKFSKLSPDEQALVLDASNGWTSLADLPDNIRKMALESRDITQDFGRMGTVAREINKVIPFFNASLQGGAKLIRLAKNNPKRFVATMAVYSAIPAITAYLNNRQYEDYQDLRDYERNKNAIWIYKDRTPEEVEAGAPLYAFKLPLPQLSQPFYVATETLARAMDNEDPNALEQTAKEMASAGYFIAGELNPFGDVTSLIPTAIKAKMQVDVNKDFYTGFEIEPKYIDTDGDGEGDTPREEVPDAYRKGYYSGPLTETLGRITGPTLGLSPAELDSIINTTTGGTGQVITNVVDSALGKPQSLATNPITKKLLFPRGGQIKSDEYAEEQKVKDLENAESFGGPGINFNNLSFNQSSASEGNELVPNQKVQTSDAQDIQAMARGEGVETKIEEQGWLGKLLGKQPKTTKVYDPGALVEESSTDTYDVRAIRDGATITIPKKQEAFSDKYSKMEKIYVDNQEKIDDINFDDTLTTSDKTKKLKELQEKFDLADQAKQIMEANYPEMVFEAQLDTYKSGGDMNVEERANWADTKLRPLYEAKGEDWQKYVNRMWEKKVFTSDVIKSLVELGYSTSDFKYTGDDKIAAKSAKSGTGSGGSKFKSAALKTPSFKMPSFEPIKIDTPDLTQVVKAYSQSGMIPMRVSDYGYKTPDYLRLQQPTAQLKTPLIQSEKIKIKGL